MDGWVLKRLHFQTECTDLIFRLRQPHQLKQQFHRVSEGSMKLPFSDVTARGNYALFLFSLWQQVGSREIKHYIYTALVAVWKHKTAATMF